MRSAETRAKTDINMMISSCLYGEKKLCSKKFLHDGTSSEKEYVNLYILDSWPRVVYIFNETYVVGCKKG